MQLINLFEEQTVALYRGDKTKYKQFSPSKAVGLLYGSGLYLTNNINVAREYGDWVTTFKLPKKYVHSALDVEKPLTPELINIIASMFPHGGDFRYFEGNQEKRCPDFKEWCELYKTHECRYAWSDGHITGGKGQYPTFDVAILGTYGGTAGIAHIDDAYKLWKKLEGKGHHGLTYAGGVNTITGSDPRGGGSRSHRVYMFWDYSIPNKSIVSQK